MPLPTNNIVLPGEKLCVEEEYMPSIGTYSEEGIVRAAIIGRVQYDIINRRVYIKSIKSPVIPKAGDIVIGVVEQMRDELATINIIGYDTNNLFKHSFTGILHISQASETRIPTLYDVIRIGDIIRAKVLNNYIPILLSIKEPRLGVIQAYCSRCGSPLIKSGDKLRCSYCGNIENRKIAFDYILRGR